MNTRTIAIDLAKEVFEVAISHRAGRISERHRLSRSQFPQFMAQQPPGRVLMEACGSAHHWARTFASAGHEVALLPAHHVRPYRRRNKTDRNDCEALLEAHRCEGIDPVPVKSVDQQQIQQLHRLREQWKGTRVARINALRGCLRELGIDFPAGAAVVLKQAPAVVRSTAVPPALRMALGAVLDEIGVLELRISAVEKQLAELSQHDDTVQRLQQIPGIGLLTSTALVAAVGSAQHFKSGRHLAAWMGITPRENSSGSRHHLGRITKRGDIYLRTLFIHGARAVLNRAIWLHRAGRPVSRLQRWAIQLHQRIGHNKAAVALANKLVRIAWAVSTRGTVFSSDHELIHHAV